MKKNKPTAGQRMIETARQALAFAEGREDHGCVVHVPADIDVKISTLKRSEKGYRCPRVNLPDYSVLVNALLNTGNMAGGCPPDRRAHFSQLLRANPTP
jgi:hypothetical protein